MRVHRIVPAAPVQRGTFPVPVTPEPEDVRNRVTPGGLPPVPNRTPWKRVGATGRYAREPFNCRAVKHEHYETAKHWAPARD